MKVRITINCCEGKNGGHCLENLCPHYQKAKERIVRNWPYVGTGFGNMYGNPGHNNFLAGVRNDLAKKSSKKPS